MKVHVSVCVVYLSETTPTDPRLTCGYTGPIVETCTIMANSRDSSLVSHKETTSPVY